MNPLQMFEDFQKFRKEFQGNNPNLNPRDYIQKMLNDGKVSPQMLEQARSMASIVGVKL